VVSRIAGREQPMTRRDELENMRRDKLRWLEELDAKAEHGWPDNVGEESRNLLSRLFFPWTPWEGARHTAAAIREELVSIEACIAMLA
jgi:hypothetical protein